MTSNVINCINSLTWELGRVDNYYYSSRKFVQSDQVFWAKTMTLLLQNLPSVPSSAPPLHYTRSHSVVCGVSSSNTDKPRIKPKITRIKVKEPDDYHSTLKALNSKGRIPRKALGQVIFLSFGCILLCIFVLAKNGLLDCCRPLKRRKLC